MTQAYAKVGVNPVDGIVYFLYRQSPEDAAQEHWKRRPRADELPALRSSSDITWGSKFSKEVSMAHKLGTQQKFTDRYSVEWSRRWFTKVELFHGSIGGQPRDTVHHGTCTEAIQHQRGAEVARQRLRIRCEESWHSRAYGIRATRI